MFPSHGVSTIYHDGLVGFFGLFVRVVFFCFDFLIFLGAFDSCVIATEHLKTGRYCFLLLPLCRFYSFWPQIDMPLISNILATSIFVPLFVSFYIHSNVEYCQTIASRRFGSIEIAWSCTTARTLPVYGFRRSTLRQYSPFSTPAE